MDKRTVLLSGASGFLGRAIYNRLKKEGYKVIPLVRSPSGLENEISIDLSDANFLQNLGKLPKLVAVIHTAAYVDFAPNYDPSIFRVNTLASYDLARLARECQALFIFTSTATISGARAKVISNESAVNPDSPYALSKWLAEELVRKVCPDHIIIRFPGIYGKGGPSHLGINRSIDLALNGQRPELRGSGSGKRNYIFVEDAARVVVNSVVNQQRGTYLSAGPEDLSIKKMLNTICEVLMPGQELLCQDGKDSTDQIVNPSFPIFTGRTSFHEAIKSLKP